MFRSRVTFLATLLLALTLPAFGQGNPTGTLSGRVVDTENGPLPGVTVTAASPVLQGVRTAVTSANGDYIIPFLPAGDYTVTFELPGLRDGQADRQPEDGRHPAGEREDGGGDGDGDGHGDGARSARRRPRRRWRPRSRRPPSR